MSTADVAVSHSSRNAWRDGSTALVPADPAFICAMGVDTDAEEEGAARAAEDTSDDEEAV